MSTAPGDHQGVTLEEQTRRLYHAKRLFAVLSAVNRAITRKPGRKELLQTICRILVEVGEFRLAWFGSPDDQGWIVPEAIFGDSMGYLESIRISVNEIPEGQGPTGTALRENRPNICNNILGNPTMRPWSVPASLYGLNSCGCFPVHLPNGAVAGFSLYSNEINFFTSDAEKLLVDIAGDIGYALEFIVAEEQRVASEEALRERVKLQEQLEHIALTVPGVIFSFRMRPDGSFCIPYASNGFQSLFGLSREQVREDASLVLSRTHPDDKHSNHESFLLSARDLTPWHREFRYLHPSLGLVWLDCHSIPQREVDGSCLWHCYVHDITERKTAEASLRAEEMKFQSLVSATSQIIWVTDGKGRATRPVPSWEAFTGLNHEETHGFGWLRALHKDDVERTGWAMNHAQQKRSIYEVEHRIRRHDGVYRYMLTRGVPVIAEDGRVSQWIGACTDITERKRAEEARAWLAALVESTDDAIVTKDLNGIIQSWNAGAERLFGYKPEEVSGHPITILIPPELQHEEDHFQQRLMTNQPIEHFETVRLTKDGQRITVSLTVSPIKDSHGKIIGTSKIVRDISLRKQAEEELARAKTVAEAANLAKSDFLANMSHEIRTPMNAVMGMTQLLEKESLSSDQQEMVKQIRIAGRSLLGILNDILDYSKIEAGQLRIELLPFNLSQLLEQIDNLLRDSAQSKGIKLKINSAATVVENLIGDSLRLQQVLVNLVSNAIKFTKQGKIQILIQPAEITETTILLRFQVSDTGVGIAPEAVALLFQPFRQADSSISRRFGGTGLGLSICKRLVELMGGTIGVESREGVGSTFWFELPFGRAAAETPSSPSVIDKTTPVAGPRLSGWRFLVVDDNSINRQLLSRALIRDGAKTIVVCDGLQAITELKSVCVDAVLMDIQMPVMDGLAATRAIRTDLGLTELPVIAVSAGVLPEERQRALDAGVNGFLPKPVDLEELIALLLRQQTPATRTEALSPAAKTPVAQQEQSGIPHITGIDADRVAVMFGNDRKFFLELFELFISRFGDTAQRLREELFREDRAVAARRLHTLRGTAGNLGALELSKSAHQLEKTILTAGSDPLPEIEQFEKELVALIDAVAPYLRNTDVAEPDEGPQLDPKELEKLRRALCFNDLSSIEMFNELEAALAVAYGASQCKAMAEAMRHLRFVEVLKLLGDVKSS